MTSPAAPAPVPTAPTSGPVGVTVGVLGIVLAVLGVAASLLLGTSGPTMDPECYFLLVALPVPGMACGSVGMAFGRRPGRIAGGIALVITIVGFVLTGIAFFG